MRRHRPAGTCSVTAARGRFPDRHASEQIAFTIGGPKFIATISRFLYGRLAEIFLTNGKRGSDSDITAPNDALVASIAFQHGVLVEALRKALMHDSQGKASGPLGVVPDLLAGEA